MFRCGQIARLENRLQHFTRLIAYEDGQYDRRIPHYTHGAAQHGAWVIDIFQKVMAKDDIERFRLKNVRQLGGVRSDSMTDESRITRTAPHNTAPGSSTYSKRLWQRMISNDSV